MVRKYIKKRSQRPEIDKKILKEAVKNVISQRMSIRLSASTYTIPKSTLFDAIKIYKKRHRFNNIEDSGNETADDDEDVENQPTSSKYTSRQVFSATEEAELEKYLKESSKICYGLTYESLRKLAYEYAVKLEKRIPSNWNQDKKAGIEWTRGFMKRHPRLTYRKPENISFARATAFNETNVSEFFKNLTAVQEKYHFPPHRIWNTDETGRRA
ncbi:hypothetical protein NQ314_017971 [Rhamnusium bicolor]|uniref:HTH CENPB-type domain-containing protein n=1 Tax=Rhamnusium bicolor TaxID=1586634 RepID=A0AAV8WT45_9CUCU|nr:hypothetical protein NQ314_017971 [Rhamnusium bicolor]